MTHMYFQRVSAWLTAFFFLVCGISAGAFTELSLPSESRAQIGAYLMEQLFSESPEPSPTAVLLQSAGNNLGLLFLIFLSGIVPLGFCAAYAVIAYKGAALGFCAALLLELLQLRGVLILLFTVLPPNLLILPALFLSVAAVINTSAAKRSRHRKKSLSSEAGSYCACFFLPFLLISAAIVIEGLICPAVLQLIK